VEDGVEAARGAGRSGHAAGGGEPGGAGRKAGGAARVRGPAGGLAGGLARSLAGGDCARDGRNGLGGRHLVAATLTAALLVAVTGGSRGLTVVLGDVSAD